MGTMGTMGDGNDNGKRLRLSVGSRASESKPAPAVHKAQLPIISEVIDPRPQYFRRSQTGGAIAIEGAELMGAKQFSGYGPARSSSRSHMTLPAHGVLKAHR